jgi:hypothetical protein
MMFDVKRMRRLDSQVGNLACSLLAGAKRLGLPGRRGSETPVRKVAVAKFFGLGSLVVAAPAVAALRDMYPGAEIHFVTFQSNKKVLEILGIADRGWFIDNSSAKAFAKTTLVAARALRKEGIDLLIDFEFSSPASRSTPSRAASRGRCRSSRSTARCAPCSRNARQATRGA